jgi:hypothetical protein
MLVDIAQLLRQPESEGFDRKSALDPTSSQDYLEFVADLVAMANTRGGWGFRRRKSGFRADRDQHSGVM